MILDPFLVLCLAQALPPGPVAPVPAASTQAAPETAAEPALEPWTDSVAEGLAEVRALTARGEHQAARQLCRRLVTPSGFARWREEALLQHGWSAQVARLAEPLADTLGLGGVAPGLRAEVLFASGVAATQGGERAEVDQDFGRALGLATSRDLRLASAYQLGTSALLEAEELRAKLPEIQKKLGTAPAAPQVPVPSVSTGPGAGPVPEIDGLALARSAYLKARERLVERLRADWRDADARANVELALKRLRELDEIEKQRQEQQQQEQDKNKDPQQKSDDQNPDAKPDPQQQKPPEDERQPEDEKPPKDEPPKDPPQDPKPPEGDPKQPQPSAPQDPREVQISKEEMMRLLDLLQQREQQWEKLQKELQQARRARARRDW